MGLIEIARATLSDFASMLRIPNDAAEDAIVSERGAKAVLTRRNLFAAAAALGSGLVVSAPTPVASALTISFEAAGINIGGATWRMAVPPMSPSEFLFRCELALSDIRLGRTP